VKMQKGAGIRTLRTHSKSRKIPNKCMLTAWPTCFT